jgi:hypothetical protein
MTSTVKLEPRKLGPFSHDEVKALLMTIGVGVVLGFAVEMVDRVLPKDHNMKAILQLIMEGRGERNATRKSSYDPGRPDVGFNFTK